MALMSEGAFPFGAVGLVHVANQITQHRRIGVERGTRPAGRGDEDLAASEREDVRRRHRGAGRSPDRLGEHQHLPFPREGRRVRRRPARPSRSSTRTTPASAEWRLPGDLGRRYAAVSGDRNPIHMHALTAKPLGFPAAIAHGMWTKARALAALESRLPDAFAADVRFRRPILLPAKVEFATEDRQGAGRRSTSPFAAAATSAATAISTAGSSRPPPSPRRQDPKERPSDHHDHRHRQGRCGARDGHRAARAELARGLRPARPHPHPQGGRAGPLPGHQTGLPHGDRRRAHLRRRPETGQTGAPVALQIEGPLRRHPGR